MFRLDNILEDFATVYKPLAHCSKPEAEHKTFYRIDTINGNNKFVQNYNDAASPALAYSTLVDGRSIKEGKQNSYRHSIYVMVKQDAPSSNADTTINDELSATDAKYDADEIIQDLRTFLTALKEEAKAILLGTTSRRSSIVAQRLAAKLPEDQLRGVAGLMVEYCMWGTMPVRYNGWWICGLEIEQIVPNNLCVNEERYFR